MRILSLTAAALLSLPLASAPTDAAAHDRHGPAAQTVTIRIACYRGPWREIIIDRPEVAFTDDLVAYGYSLAEAEAIGNRVCRDPAGLDDPGYLVTLLQDILRRDPPRQHR